MRFGPFVLQISPDPSLDSRIIDSTLKEAELADALGYDVIWLTEHYFGGDTVYADPVVFGAAVAARHPEHQDWVRRGTDGVSSSSEAGGSNRSAGQPQSRAVDRGDGAGFRL